MEYETLSFSFLLPNVKFISLFLYKSFNAYMKDMNYGSDGAGVRQLILHAVQKTS
jgi:hypothetical protein